MQSSLSSIIKLSRKERRERGLEYTPEEIQGQVELWPDTCNRICLLYTSPSPRD